ncbi:MAG: hypothetical protein AABX33_00265 [Nanoarchaeota archaeon]
MAQGTQMSEHTSTKEGFVYVVEGKGFLLLKAKKYLFCREFLYT